MSSLLGGRYSPLVLAILAIAILAGTTIYLRGGGQESVETAPQQLDDYSGRVLAGQESPYLEFSPADFELATATNKLIVLNFYANWCPICRAEEPVLVAGFNRLTNPSVIGFRVNYKDDQTSGDENALADRLKITYQHTKVLLRGQNELARSGESWDQATFESTIKQYLTPAP